jgi:hypothetical protein
MKTTDNNSKLSPLTLKRRREGIRLVAEKGWTRQMLANRWGVSKARVSVIVGRVRRFEALK